MWHAVEHGHDLAAGQLAAVAAPYDRPRALRMLAPRIEAGDWPVALVAEIPDELVLAVADRRGDQRAGARLPGDRAGAPRPRAAETIALAPRDDQDRQVIDAVAETLCRMGPGDGVRAR